MKKKSVHKVESINPNFQIKRKQELTVNDYVKGILNRDISAISGVISLIENTNSEKRKLGVSILNQVYNKSEETIRIGVTGSPGVGKSTFIEQLGIYIADLSNRVAVLAIDPSSNKSKGAILGDKTRMEKLAQHPNAFIRPSSAGQNLGGTAYYTKDVISLCEASGYNFIIVETVGVGQSEIDVTNITDLNILLIQPGSGDDLQGIKRGIVENADIIVVHKSDGDLKARAIQTKQYYEQSISYFQHKLNGWRCPVILVSSITKEGIPEVYETIRKYLILIQENHKYIEERKRQDVIWFRKEVKRTIESIIIDKHEKIKWQINNLEEEILNGKLVLSSAIHNVEELLEKRIRIND